ncbi:hypothetical protein ACE103_08480 [Bradyrhizobium sp. ma5]
MAKKAKKAKKAKMVKKAIGRHVPARSTDWMRPPRSKAKKKR